MWFSDHAAHMAGGRGGFPNIADNVKVKALLISMAKPSTQQWTGSHHYKSYHWCIIK